LRRRRLKCSCARSAETVAEDSTGTSDAERMPPADEAWRPSGARAPVPEPPPLPCNMQNWTEGERVCLSWTAPLEAAKAEAVVVPGLSVRVRLQTTQGIPSTEAPRLPPNLSDGRARLRARALFHGACLPLRATLFDCRQAGLAGGLLGFVP